MSQGMPWMCTGRIAFVCSVIRSSMRAGSMVNVFGSMSAKTGMALWWRTAAAVDQ